jgi:phospholipid-binding lipoprotein MlaA
VSTDSYFIGFIREKFSMPKATSARATLGVAWLLSMSACVTLPPNSPRSPQDPWESWNRGVYNVNEKLDRAVARPVARIYVRIVPRPIRTGVSNFFDNLDTPTVMINDALQGKFLAASSDLGRFLFNSTVGLGGILDPASRAGMAKNNEDFGQTLGHWGVHAGPFVELPILGPSDLRDAPSRVVDAYTNPRQYVRNSYVKYGLWVPALIDTRASLLPLDETLKHVYDPYAVIRDAYLQRRAYLVSDGKVTEEPLIDPGDAQDPDQPPSSTKPTSPPQTPAGDDSYAAQDSLAPVAFYKSAAVIK